MAHVHPLRRVYVETPDTGSAAMAAADAILVALKHRGARLAISAFRAGWLNEEEVKLLEPVAAGIAYLLGDGDATTVPLPAHRKGGDS